jgi:DnaJ-class molecular chaperone
MANDPCSTCGGTGRIHCNHCGGSGINQNSSLLNAECRGCQGTGKEICQPCRGSGEWPPLAHAATSHK